MWASPVVFIWGLIATLQATASSWSGLAACRFFIGIVEAGFALGVALYLTYFYPRDNLGLREGIFASAAPAASAYGGALAYGISQIRGSVAPWRILFIIEGAPTCLIAILVWFVLPDSVDSCWFLNDQEKKIARSFVARNQISDYDDGNGKVGLRFTQLLQAFKDPKSKF